MTRPVIQVRHAGLADAEQWRQMRSALWPDEDPAAHATEVSRFFAEAGSGGALPEAVLVALPAGGSELIGFAEVSRRPYAEGCDTSPVGFLEGWYVQATHRRLGVGRALLAAAEAWARAKGCSEFASDALAENADGAAAHRALGFEEVAVIRCFRKRLT